jgi:hypothetical protein
MCLTSCNVRDDKKNTWLNSASADIPSTNGKALQIPDPLIHQLSKLSNKEAVNMLENNPIKELDMIKTARLLNLDSVDPNEFVVNAYTEFEKMAKIKEDAAKNPFLSADAAKILLDQATQYRIASASTKDQLGKLRPYLVRGLALNEETGYFSVYLVGSELWVYHSSSGKEQPPALRRPLIVFLKSKPSKVHVGINMMK